MVVIKVNITRFRFCTAQQSIDRGKNIYIYNTHIKNNNNNTDVDDDDDDDDDDNNNNSQPITYCL